MHQSGFSTSWTKGLGDFSGLPRSEPMVGNVCRMGASMQAQDFWRIGCLRLHGLALRIGGSGLGVWTPVGLSRAYQWSKTRRHELLFTVWYRFRLETASKFCFGFIDGFRGDRLRTLHPASRCMCRSERAMQEQWPKLRRTTSGCSIFKGVWQHLDLGSASDCGQ
jgi:hypothetical protein